MLTIRELIKTLYNALIQKLKNHRGNWEQNDPTADDYIKNRPFYVDENKTITIIPKQTVAFNSERGAVSTVGTATIPLSPIIELVVGQEYDVVWDGKKYKCTAYEFDGLAVIGSNFIMNGLFDDEPFFIAISKEMFSGAYLGTEDTNSHVVEVTTKYIKKLDKKYLPDDLNLDLADVAYSGSYYDLYDTPTIYSDVVRYGTTQSLSTTQKTTAKTNIEAVGYDAQTLTDAQKTQARTNIDAVSSEDITGVVKYSTEQSLTDEQKEVARNNIGAADEVKVEELITSAKEGILFADEINSYKYVVCMRGGNLATYCATSSIEVTTMPIKVEYITGEYFDPTGMVVTATAYDDSTREITNYTYSTNYLTEDTAIIVITYVEAGIVHTTSIPITVDPFDAETVLVDFTYTSNDDGTYTITGWKETLNGESSTELIIPNNGLILV